MSYIYGRLNENPNHRYFSKMLQSLTSMKFIIFGCKVKRWEESRYQDIFSFQFSRNLPIFRHSSLPRTSRRTSGVQLDHLGSFKQQLEYLLTSRERSQLKRALQNYATRRDAARLLEDMVLVLDTPSKRTLWLYIIPLLSTPHQNFCRIQLKIPPSVGTSGKEYLDVFEDRPA